MDSASIISASKKTTLWSWSRTADVNPLVIARGEGIYLFTPEGKRYLDFSSQLMSVNIGHGHPKVREAMKAQIDQITYVAPSLTTEVRARLGEKLAAIMPGDLNTSFFTLGGTDAVENAVRAARLYTGRNKVLSRYRSYHGGTLLSMRMSGDPRRIQQPSLPGGVVQVFHDTPYGFSFGDSPEAICENYLRYIAEVIQEEGPNQIAAFLMESVTGTNGVLAPTPGLMPKLKALLASHGILLIADEVMAGFGRTGELMAFQHFGVQPDLVTAAKGLTSSYAPLGLLMVSDPIAQHFEHEVFWGGLTYNAHPLSLATALAVIEVIESEGLIDNARRMGAYMRGWMQRMQSRHPSVLEHRNLGLFGLISLAGPDGKALCGYNQSHPAMKTLASLFREAGLFTIFHWNSFMCCPPLSITQPQLDEAFAIIDAGLSAVDASLA